MEWLSDISHWIVDNEALLSGLAALIVVVGVIISPFGLGFRRVLGSRQDLESSVSETAAPGPVAPVDPLSTESTDTRHSTEGGPSIAVLPFDNMSDDKDQAYLADGMTEDIITGLAATPRLTVIARNSTFAYKGQSPDIRGVGRDLGVRYVLEGSVRRVGEKIRVTVQLIEAETAKHLWAEKYDRLYSEIFDVQDEVVSDIAGALSLQITRAEVTRARTVPPSNLAAWELVTQVTHSHFRHSPALEGNREMLDKLQQAVELDESYGYARAAYAWMLASSAINGWAKDHLGTFQEARSQLSTALELDTSDALSQFYIGAAYTYIGRWDKSVRFLQRSLALNPHQPDAMVHLGLAWGYCAEFDKAYTCFDKAARMGSTESHEGFYAWYRGIVLSLEDRFEEAIETIEVVSENFDYYQTPKTVLALAYEMTGRPDKAKALIERAHAMEPELNVNGLAMNIGAHFDREKGRERAAVLMKYWPG